MALHDRLRQILETKKGEVARLQPKAALLKAAAAERNEFRSFQDALTADRDSLALIAEVKKASPSAGVITADFDPVAMTSALRPLSKTTRRRNASLISGAGLWTRSGNRTGSPSQRASGWAMCSPSGTGSS